jgi:hypothetical protein
LFDEKQTEGRKSRDTVPLRTVKKARNIFIIYFLFFSTKSAHAAADKLQICLPVPRKIILFCTPTKGGT